MDKIGKFDEKLFKWKNIPEKTVRVRRQRLWWIKLRHAESDGKCAHGQWFESDTLRISSMRNDNGLPGNRMIRKFFEKSDFSAITQFIYEKWWANERTTLGREKTEDISLFVEDEQRLVR